jgi:hypothetical protein
LKKESTRVQLSRTRAIGNKALKEFESEQRKWRETGRL